MPRRSQDCLDKGRKKVVQPLLYIGQSDIHCQPGMRKLQQFGCRLAVLKPIFGRVGVACPGVMTTRQAVSKGYANYCYFGLWVTTFKLST